MTWLIPVVPPLNPTAWKRPPGSREYRVTSPFGWRVRNGRRELHDAIDIGNGHLGGDVLATAAGTVLAVGNLLRPWSDPGPYASGNMGGLMVVIDHPGGRRSRYAHLANTFVLAGQRVAAGDRIGLLGDSGSAIGQGHLHFSIGDATGWLDPEPLITAPESREDRLAREAIGWRLSHPHLAAMWEQATRFTQALDGHAIRREDRLAAGMLMFRAVAPGAAADYEAWSRLVDGQPLAREDRLAAFDLFMRAAAGDG